MAKTCTAAPAPAASAAAPASGKAPDLEHVVIKKTQNLGPSGPVTFIKLSADWRDFSAGRVLPASADLLSMLEVEGVPYTAATDRERGIAGFPNVD